MSSAGTKPMTAIRATLLAWAFKYIQTDLQRQMGRQIVDSGNVRILTESAKLVFEPVHLIESRCGRLPGVALVLVHDEDLVGGRHRFM